jgi:hypothetical protein
MTMPKAPTDEQEPDVAAQISNLQYRVGAMEHEAKDGRPGWVARFGAANLVIRRVGSLAATIGAAVALYHLLIAYPNVRLMLVRDNIEVRWNAPSRLVSFDCWLMAKNDGRKADTLLARRARMIAARGATLPLQDIRLKNPEGGIRLLWSA